MWLCEKTKTIMSNSVGIGICIGCWFLPSGYDNKDSEVIEEVSSKNVSVKESGDNKSFKHTKCPGKNKKSF